MENGRIALGLAARASVQGGASKPGGVGFMTGARVTFNRWMITRAHAYSGLMEGAVTGRHGR